MHSDSDKTKRVAPPMTWPTRLFVLAVGCGADATCRVDGIISRRLLDLLDPPVPPSAAPREGVATRDVVVDPAIPLRARLFYPCRPTGGEAGGGGGEAGATKPLPVVVFFHGGGFAFLSAASRAYDAACRRIARYAGAAVLSVDYRRSPEHRYPTPYDDGLAALRFLDDPNNHPSPPTTATSRRSTSPAASSPGTARGPISRTTSPAATPSPRTPSPTSASPASSPSSLSLSFDCNHYIKNFPPLHVLLFTPSG
jgi:hypothetical protein